HSLYHRSRALRDGPAAPDIRSRVEGEAPLSTALTVRDFRPCIKNRRVRRWMVPGASRNRTGAAGSKGKTPGAYGGGTGPRAVGGCLHASCGLLRHRVAPRAARSLADTKEGRTMSRTRPLRPMLLATLGLVLILGVLPVAPSAADDGGATEPTATTLE